MEINPHIFHSKIFHKRFFPKVNQFKYNASYLYFPLSKLYDNNIKKPFKINQFSALSFFEKDHGKRDGSHLEVWIRNMLSEFKINSLIHEIVLVTMPRVLGYVFNPVSFWFCLDKNKELRAVVCEVNNTFKETHTYVCMHEDRRVITKKDQLKVHKAFHVSPFLNREGHYLFRFSFKQKTLGIWIDYYDAIKNKQLVTSFVGKLKPLSKFALFQSFYLNPFISLKVIFLIHWQAVKLVFKKIQYIKKPLQKKERYSK